MIDRSLLRLAALALACPTLAVAKLSPPEVGRYGGAPAVRALRVAGTEMQLASVCKPHDCVDHNAVLLYDAAQPAVYAKVHQAGRTTLLGNPPPPIAAALEPLWQQEWRSGK